MKEIEKLKEEILKDYPRLTLDSEFSFACHPGVPCFNSCCADVNIFLTPYDIIRLKNRLGITSAEFLSKYTLSPLRQKPQVPGRVAGHERGRQKGLPVRHQGGLLGLRRPAVGLPHVPAGPGVTEGRQEQPGDDDNDSLKEDFYFLLQESICKGFKEDKKQTVAGWLEGQGITEYDNMVSRVERHRDA